MARLIKCRDCDHDISKKAKSCPNCGAPQKKRTHSVTKLLAIIILGSMAVAIFSGGDGSSTASGSKTYASSKTTSTARAASSAKAKPASNKAMFLADKTRALAWMEKDKSSVKALLKDPDSAKFDRVYISFMNDFPVTCGKVNAKNGFGGYTGFKEFVAAQSAGISVVRGDGQMVDSEFVKVWDAACKDPIQI